ncbi:TrmB family transcriptional regulator [Patescibacteria group bacterium]
MENELQKLGYSPNQAKIYLALLELGQTTVGPIIKKTGLHRQVVYNTLEELAKLDLVQSTLKNNRQNFEIVDTHKIIDNIKKQESLAEEILPDLLAKQKKTKAAQEIKVYEGVEGFQAMTLNNIKRQPANSTYHVLGAGGPQWVAIMQKNNFLPKLEKLRLEKNIKVELVAYENMRTVWEKLVKKVPGQSEKDLKIFKYFPSSYDNPISIQVWNDRVTLNTYTEPIIVVEIKNIDFVKNFKHYFDSLWTQEVKTYRGFEAFKHSFYDIIRNDLKDGGEYHVINANITVEAKYKGYVEFFKKFHQDRQKAGVYIKLLFAERSKNFVKENKNNFNFAEVKYLPQEIQTPMQINVYKNKTIMVLVEKEPLIFVIENQNVADSYEQYFQAFWKIGKK